MKTNYVPAIVMLSAGLVYCLIALRDHIGLMIFTKQLLIVLVVFWVLGGVVKIVLDKTMIVAVDDEETSQEQDSTEEAEESEDTVENIQTEDVK